MKIFGLSLIFVCSVGIGVYISRIQKKVLEQAKEILDFMIYIKQQIEYFNMPLNEIYSSFENQNQIFSSLVNEISANGWNISLKNKNNIILPDNCISILNNFGNMLGKSEKKDQLQKCNYYIREFELEYEKLKQNIPQKTKASFALSIYIGLMIIIIFL